MWLLVVALNQWLAQGLIDSREHQSISLVGVHTKTHNLLWNQCLLCHMEAGQWLEHQQSCYKETGEWIWQDDSYGGSLTMLWVGPKPPDNISQIWFSNVRHVMKLSICQWCYRKRYNCSEECNFWRYSWTLSSQKHWSRYCSVILKH